MKKFIFFICLLAGISFGATSQIVSTGPITVISTNLTSLGGSAVYTRSTTLQSAATDTVTLKVQGGNQNDAIHIWTEMTKGSGTTDSLTITIWGLVKSSTGGTNTAYKSLFSDQTANISGPQVFDHILTGNNYTDYMIVVKTINVLTPTQRSMYRYAVLIR